MRTVMMVVVTVFLDAEDYTDGMDPQEFRQYGRDMVEYIANYSETVGEKTPLPAVSPGYLKDLIPNEAPKEKENWDDVMKDIDRVIMPGMTHWLSNNFHAYFTTGQSFSSVLGGMLSDGIACHSFSWISSPVCTELEMSMVNWLAKMLQLPSQFLFSDSGYGGGVIEGSASETTLIALSAARHRVSQQLKSQDPALSQGQIIDKLVAYTSEEAHSSVERAARIGVVKIRKLPTDENGSLRGPALEEAIKGDEAKGMVPFFLCATIGTTSTCSYDNLEELGTICDAHNIWMHVDACYAGGACICPEFRYLLNGVEHATSLNVSPHKLLMVNYDCSVLWVQDSRLVTCALNVEAAYLDHATQTGIMPEYRHWRICLGCRFRSVKLWFVLRMTGIAGLQEHIRKHATMTKEFERFVREDDRFEVFRKVTLGLACFRLKGDNEINKILLKRINEDRRIHLVPSEAKGIYFLRFAVCSSKVQSSDIAYAWKVIGELATQLLKDTNNAR